MAWWCRVQPEQRARLGRHVLWEDRGSASLRSACLAMLVRLITFLWILLGGVGCGDRWFRADRGQAAHKHNMLKGSTARPGVEYENIIVYSNKPGIAKHRKLRMLKQHHSRTETLYGKPQRVNMIERVSSMHPETCGTAMHVKVIFTQRSRREMLDLGAVAQHMSTRNLQLRHVHTVSLLLSLQRCCKDRSEWVSWASSSPA